MISLKTDFLFHLILSLLFVFISQKPFAQTDVYKDVSSEKYKLENKIKKLILKTNEAQKNILFLNEEIKEVSARIEEINLERQTAYESIKRNIFKFSIDIIKNKKNDTDYKNQLRLQTFKNWNQEFFKLEDLSKELNSSNQAMMKSKEDLRKSIIESSSLMSQVANEVEDLDVLQKYLRNDLEVSGPDSEFFEKMGKLKAPVSRAKLVESKGFYKIPGERVFSYSDGLRYEVQRGDAVYPISTGILEGEIYVPNLGYILIVKHTENIRSFYIGAVAISGVMVNDPLSPDQQFGLVKSSTLELKLRFDTESLDPSEWIRFRR